MGPVRRHRSGSHLRRLDRRRSRFSGTSTAASPPLKPRGGRHGERLSLKYALERISVFFCIIIEQACAAVSCLLRALSTICPVRTRGAIIIQIQTRVYTFHKSRRNADGERRENLPFDIYSRESTGKFIGQIILRGHGVAVPVPLVSDVRYRRVGYAADTASPAINELANKCRTFTLP